MFYTYSSLLVTNTSASNWLTFSPLTLPLSPNVGGEGKGEGEAPTEKEIAAFACVTVWESDVK